MDQGILFILVSYLGMPTETPAEGQKALVLALVVLFAGMLVCPGLSAFTAWLRLRSYPRE